MSKHNLERSFSMIFLSVGSLIVAVLGGVHSSDAQPAKLIPIEIAPGPPDLTVYVTASKTKIAGPIPPEIKERESSLITITVHNRLTAPQLSQLPQHVEGSLRLSGSEAKGVTLNVEMTEGLSQVGNMIVPRGFQCAVATNNHFVFCWGGTIPAGVSVQFQVEVIAAFVEAIKGYDCGVGRSSVRAVVDAHNFILEASEVNNEASSAITIDCID
jgi:hypothetical protein